MFCLRELRFILSCFFFSCYCQITLLCPFGRFFFLFFFFFICFANLLICYYRIWVSTSLTRRLSMLFCFLKALLFYFSASFFSRCYKMLSHHCLMVVYGFCKCWTVGMVHDFCKCWTCGMMYGFCKRWIDGSHF